MDGNIFQIKYRNNILKSTQTGNVIFQVGGEGFSNKLLEGLGISATVISNQKIQPNFF